MRRPARCDRRRHRLGRNDHRTDAVLPQRRAVVEFVLADPAGSILADYVTTGRHGEAGAWAVEGIGEDFIPPIADLSAVRRAYSITDEESFATARELLRAEGILGGSSTGTLLAAALRYLQRADVTQARRDVRLRHRHALSVEGLQRPVDARPGPARAAAARRPARPHLAAHDEGSVVSVGPEDTLLTAFQRMRLADVSQLPVLDGERLAGVIDESDLLMKVHAEPAMFRSPVASAMTTKLHTLPPGGEPRGARGRARSRAGRDRRRRARLLRPDHARRPAEPSAQAAGMTRRRSKAQP